MEVLTEHELNIRKDEIVERILSGEIFIHPTDTIYGIGCNAQIFNSVQKIREIKQRFNSPFSIWIPSLKWIEQNCNVDKANEWIAKLPGPYTLILPLRKEAIAKKFIAKNVSPNNKTIGVRLPDHWFSKIVELCGIPIVTTSANKTGDPFMTSIEKLDSELKNNVDFMIYEGEKKGRPSKVVNITEQTVKER